MRRPTVPRCLGHKIFEVPSTLARRPRSAIFYRRSPTPACGLGPRPHHGRVPRRFPRDAFLLFACFPGSLPSQRDHTALLEVMTDVRPIHPPYCWPTALACIHPLRRPGTSLGVFGIQFQHRVSFPGQHRIGHTHLRHSEHRSRSSSHLLQLSHRHQRLQCGVDGIGVSSGWKAPSRQALPSR